MSHSSPAQQFADAAGLSLAGDELLLVIQRDQPPLTAERAHLSNVVDIHQRIAVNAHAHRVRPNATIAGGCAELCL